MDAASEFTKLSVHRCRFVDWTPGEITAVAFSPLAPPNSSSHAASTSSSSASNYGILAIGRGNGTIEICEWSHPEAEGIAYQAWTTRRVLAGPNPSKVDSLVFTLKDPFSHVTGTAPGIAHLRLFSTAGGKDLLEWDLASGTVKRVYDSDAGAIWSISANPTSTVLALGCDDGSIRLLSLADEDIVPLRRLDRVKTRILTLAWGPPRYVAAVKKASGAEDNSDSEDEDDEARWNDSYIVAGCSDGSARKWDASTGRVLERMTMDQIKGEKTIVWTVGVLADGTVVTGDSLGTVKFWDPLTSTLISSFQVSDADILCLTVGSDQKSVYASGVDQRVHEFSLVAVGASTAAVSGPPQWIHTRSRRLHAHDVRCIAIWPPPQLFPHKFLPKSTVRERTAPVLATGGLDKTLILTPVAPPSLIGATALNPFLRGQAPSFEDSFYRRVPYAQLGASGGRIVQVAPKARYVMCRYDTKVSVWCVQPPRPQSLAEVGTPATPEDAWKKMLDMDLKVDTTLSSSAISADGQWMAVSDAYETKLFKIVHKLLLGSVSLHPKRIKTLTHTLQTHFDDTLGTSSTPRPTAASSIQFSPDSGKLVLAISTLVVVLDLPSRTEKGKEGSTVVSVIRSFPHHRLHPGGSGSGTGRVIKPLPGRETHAMDEDGANGNSTVKNGAESGDSDSDSDDDGDDGPNRPLDRDSWPQISQMSISEDGQWLATSDLQGRTHVFNLDAVKHHCTLPTSPLPATSLAFDIHPSSNHILVLAFPNNSIQVFDVEAREFPAWAQAVNEKLPYGLDRMQDALVGIAFIPEDPSDSIDGSSALGSRSTSLTQDRRVARNVVLWGRGWLCKVDLMSGGPAHSGPGITPSLQRKRKQSFAPSDAKRPNGVASKIEADQPQGLTGLAVTKYRDLMLVDFIGPKEMVVIERPSVDILQGLRPAYYRPKYGKK